MPDDRDDGFATLDAMMALVILAVTVAMTLSAARVALRLGTAAIETRSADRLLSFLIDDGGAQLGVASGRSGQFEWTRTVKVTTAQPLQLCRRDAEARALRSGRLYSLQLDGACPPIQEAAR